MGSLSRSASGRGFSTTAPIASPRTVPLARSSKVKHFPSLENSSAWDDETYRFGVEFRFPPPATATSQFPSARLSHAYAIAARVEEQAVSTKTAGPTRSKMYESLEEEIDSVMGRYVFSDCWIMTA